ncbi:hypothetical protein Bca101_065734 [Brassica carinata]
MWSFTFNYAYYSQLTFILLNVLEFKWCGIHWTCDQWSLVLVDDVLIDRFSFSSILLSLSGIYIDSVRSRTAVCSFFIVSSLAFGAVILLFSFWWQLEEKHIGIFHLVNVVLMDIEFSVVSCLEQYLFFQNFFLYGVNWKLKSIARLFFPTNALLCFWCRDCDTFGLH